MADAKTVKMKGRILRMFYKSPTFSTGEMKITKVLNSTAREDAKYAKFAGKIYCDVGDDVIVEGVWEVDPKWGAQLKVSGFQFDASLGREGLIQFLAKDSHFKGIGPAKAEKIVEAIEGMGGDFEDALEKVPVDQLAIQAGVKPDLIQTLKTEWFKRREMNRVMAELAQYEVSPGQAQALYEEFGPTVVGIVMRDPYWLIGRVRGFGFKRVDKIALGTGISRDHSSRLKHGTLWILSEASRDGHTHITTKGLVHDATKLLALNNKAEQEALGLAIKNMIANGELIRLKHDTIDALWDVRMHGIEASVAKMMIRNGAREQHLLWMEGRKAEWTLEDVRTEFPDLARKQAEAVLSAAKYRLSVITGGAGVGKTYTVDAICRLFEALGSDNIALCAPTGKAAKRMEESMNRSASTIHMLLQPAPTQTADGVKFLFQYNAKNPLVADLIVVDEVSMVDVRLFKDLLDAVDWERTVVVLVGDHNQLPPVGPGAVLRDIVMKGDICPVTVLDKVHRQAGELKESISAVLDGKLMKGHKSAEKSGGPLRPWYVLNQFPGTPGILNFVRYMIETRLAQYTRTIKSPDGNFDVHVDPIWDVQVLTPMRKGDIGVNALNRLIQRLHQAQYGVEVPQPKRPDEMPKLFLHDKVICTRNNYKVGVMNGAMGRVTMVTKSDDTLAVEFDGIGEKIFKGQDVKDIQLAYAMTVHKSQGSEYPVVLFVCHKSHAIMHHRGLLYTAVSRARNTAIIIGDAWGMRQCATKVQTDKRRTMMGLPNPEMNAALALQNSEK